MIDLKDHGGHGNTMSKSPAKTRKTNAIFFMVMRRAAPPMTLQDQESGSSRQRNASAGWKSHFGRPTCFECFLQFTTATHQRQETGCYTASGLVSHS